MDPKKVRIVFMGTPDFAVESLRALVENQYHVVGVITAPDKPAGRGRKFTEPPAVKSYAVSVGLPVLQPEKLKNPEFLEELEALKADLQIIVAFRMLPEVVWSMPPMGTFNLHGSLLPQYRGARPLNWAVINGETPIGEDETVGDIHDRLMVTGARLVLKTVDALALGDVTPVPQEALVTDPDLMKPAPKLFRETMRIDWSGLAPEVRNLIRGLSPYPAAWTTIEHKDAGTSTEVKIFFAQLSNGDPAAPGTIQTDGRKFLKVACGEGWLNITELQLSGKKRMKTDEFLRGFQQVGQYKFV